MIGSNGRVMVVNVGGSGGGSKIKRLYNKEPRDMGPFYSSAQLVPPVSSSFSYNAVFVAVHSDFDITLNQGEEYEITVPFTYMSPTPYKSYVPALCKRVEDYNSSTWTFEIITKPHAECDCVHIGEYDKKNNPSGYNPVILTIGRTENISILDELYVVFISDGQPMSDRSSGLFASPGFGWGSYYMYKYVDMQCWYGMNTSPNAPIGYLPDGFDVGTKIYQCWEAPISATDGLLMSTYGGSPNGVYIGNSSYGYGSPCMYVTKVSNG